MGGGSVVVRKSVLWKVVLDGGRSDYDEYEFYVIAEDYKEAIKLAKKVFKKEYENAYLFASNLRVTEVSIENSEVWVKEV